MSLQLIAEKDTPKEGQNYSVRVYFDADTNTQRNEYLLDEEIMYFIEFEVHVIDEPENDIRIDSLVEGFDSWYELVGPAWRPQAF